MKFYSFDLDLDLITFVLKLDLDIVKMYACTEYEVPSFSGSKVSLNISQTDTETDRHRLKLLPYRGW